LTRASSLSKMGVPYLQRDHFKCMTDTLITHPNLKMTIKGFKEVLRILARRANLVNIFTNVSKSLSSI
jgi:hypothetical protein